MYLVLASLAVSDAVEDGVDGADEPYRTRGEVTRDEERDETLKIILINNFFNLFTESACSAPDHRHWQLERVSVAPISSSLCAAQNWPNRRVNHYLTYSTVHLAWFVDLLDSYSYSA